MSEAVLNNPAALGAFGLIVLILVAVIAFKAGGNSKAASSSTASGFNGARAVKAKVVWFETSEGPFSNAFEYQARKGMKDGGLRELLILIVKGWDHKNLGGLVLKHPGGRESQVMRFMGGQKVNGKPYLAIEYVSFTSDKRRTKLFLEGLQYEEISCSSHEGFELVRKHILSYKEGGRKTCPKSNLALRDTFIAPVQTVDP